MGLLAITHDCQFVRLCWAIIWANDDLYVSSLICLCFMVTEHVEPTLALVTKT